jgi:hypothetical protein
MKYRKKYYYKFSDISKEWVNNLPKYINSNGCWILSGVPDSSGYIAVYIEKIRFSLSRLVVSIYYNLNYDDQKWDTRHSKGCSKACFNIQHLQPGTHGDNNRDTVEHGTHHNTRKEVCSICGGPFETIIQKKGRQKGRIMRFCRTCKNRRKKEYRRIGKID